MSDVLASALRPVFERHGIALAVLFGSAARGTAHDGSDLDIGVEHRDGRRLTLIQLGRLLDDLAALSSADFDVVDLRSADCLVRFEIARDGRVLHEDASGRWTSFVGRTLVDHDDIAPFLPALVAGVGRAARARRS